MGYSYTLSGAIDHSDEVADSDSFAVVVADVDGDEDDSTLTIAIGNDGPIATTAAVTDRYCTDTPKTIDVFNDIAGADGVAITSDETDRTSMSQSHNADGDICLHA